MKHTSSCSCGKVTFQSDKDPIRISICHCFACQKRTGSVFGVQARFLREKVVTEGLTNQYVRTVEDDEKLTYHFCPNCGSTVFWFIESLPEIIGAGVGNFANQKFPKPSAAVFESRRHPWVEMPNLDLEHFDQINQ